MRSRPYRLETRSLHCKVPIRAWGPPRTSAITRPHRRHERGPFHIKVCHPSSRANPLALYSYPLLVFGPTALDAMAATPDGRSAARVRRKPPPAFPYSPRYPHPDPSDPFAPLQVLRDRAHTHAFFNPSNTSLVPTPPSSGENVRFSTHLHPNLPSLPRPVVHASRSTEPVPQFRDGYYSDNLRPARPPRARTRPTRDSNAYLTDPDVSSSTSSLNHRHHDRSQRPSEKLTDRQYHYRRRSNLITHSSGAPSGPVDG